MNSNKTEGQKDRTKVEQAITLANKHELFHDENGEGYITINENNHYVTYAINSLCFKNWLQKIFSTTQKVYLNRNILNEAIDNILSMAKFSENQHSVYKRVAQIKNTIYLDIGDNTHDCIEINANGWKIISSPNIKFVRNQHMRALPRPIQTKGNINLLWQYINIPENQQVLILAWLIESLRLNTAYPILFLTGCQGSAKSTTQEILKKLIDPNASNLRSAPKKSEDFMISSSNNYLLSFNNLSRLSANQQDDLCCISTGGGYATREYYTTTDEIVIDIKRPIIMNGISEVITAPDLLERSIIIPLPIISAKERKAESEMTVQFADDYPLIVTGLLDLIVKTLNYLPGVTLDALPRMADFAKLGKALELALNSTDIDFLATFQANQNESEIASLESSPVILSLINFIENKTCWNGTYQQLLHELNKINFYHSNNWPKNAKELSETLKRHQVYLTRQNITIQRESRKNTGYKIKIFKSSETSSLSTLSSLQISCT